MRNRIRIEQWEYTWLKRKFKKMISIGDVTKRWMYGRKIVNTFYIHHCNEIDIIFVDRFQSLLTSVNWGDSYIFRRIAYANLMKVLREQFFKTIEFEEV